MEQKDCAPDLEAGNDIDPLIRTYYQFTQLKRLYRQGWLQAGVPKQHCETVAEHSLGVVLLTALLGLEQENVDFDLRKALLMALFHDFGEIYAGDLTPKDEVSKETKHELEREAVLRVFDGFEEADYIFLLWDEYEAGKSVEARFVRQLDRLEMGLQASVYKKAGCLESAEGFIRSMSEIATDPKIRELASWVEKSNQTG